MRATIPYRADPATVQRRDPGLRSAGFSLFELVLVLVIIGALALVAGGRWSGWTGDLDGAADTLAADLRFAQSRALHDITSYRIVFGSGGRYAIQRQEGEENFGDARFADGSRERELPRGVQRSGPAGDEIRFRYPLGDLDGDASITLSRNGAQRSLRVVAETGYVER